MKYCMVHYVLGKKDLSITIIGKSKDKPYKECVHHSSWYGSTKTHATTAITPNEGVLQCMEAEDPLNWYIEPRSRSHWFPGSDAVAP